MQLRRENGPLFAAVLERKFSFEANDLELPGYDSIFSFKLFKMDYVQFAQILLPFTNCDL